MERGLVAVPLRPEERTHRQERAPHLGLFEPSVQPLPLAHDGVVQLEISRPAAGPVSHSASSFAFFALAGEQTTRSVAISGPLTLPQPLTAIHHASGPAIGTVCTPSLQSSSLSVRPSAIASTTTGTISSAASDSTCAMHTQAAPFARAEQETPRCSTQPTDTINHMDPVRSRDVEAAASS